MLIRCSDRGLQNVSRGQGRNSPLPKDASYASGAALSEILPAILHAVMNNGYLKAQCCRNHVFSERASCPRQIMHLSPSQGTFIESLLFRRAREHPRPRLYDPHVQHHAYYAAPFRERPPSRPGSVRVIVTAQAMIANRRSP